MIRWTDDLEYNYTGRMRGAAWSDTGRRARSLSRAAHGTASSQDGLCSGMRRALRRVKALLRDCVPALMAAILVAASAHGATVRLKPEATVSGSVIRLSDVARITGEAAARTALGAVEIGPAPLPGYSRSVSPDAIRIRLRQRSMDPSVLVTEAGAQCKVTRAAQTVAADRLLETARAFLEGNLEAGDGRLVVEPVSRPREMTLAEGKLDLVPEEVGAATGAYRRVAVRALVDGEEAARVDVSLRVHRYAKVAVARKPIARGEAVSTGAVAYEERDCMSLGPDVLCEADRLDGLQATTYIAAGSVLTARNAAQPPLVHRGDAVTLVARVGGIEVSAPGVAVEDGRLGQSIRVKNGTQDARATVRDARTVEALL